MIGLILKLLRVTSFLGRYGVETKGGPSTGTLTGTRAKAVKCEKCQFDYLYKVTGKATGVLSSPDGRGSETVEHKLDFMLDNIIEPIPCPSCGWTQANMIPIAKARYKRWMKTASGISLAAAVGGMLLGWASLADQTSSVGGWELTFGFLCLIMSIGFYVGRVYLVSKFDPNATDPEIRKATGRQLAITKEDYDKTQAEAQEKKLDRREQAKRNMMSGYGLTRPIDELVSCRYCGYRQEAKSKKCVSCKKVLEVS